MRSSKERRFTHVYYYAGFFTGNRLPLTYNRQGKDRRTSSFYTKWNLGKDDSNNSIFSSFHDCTIGREEKWKISNFHIKKIHSKRVKIISSTCRVWPIFSTSKKISCVWNGKYFLGDAWSIGGFRNSRKVQKKPIQDKTAWLKANTKLRRLSWKFLLKKLDHKFDPLLF